MILISNATKGWSLSVTRGIMITNMTLSIVQAYPNRSLRYNNQ